MKKKIKLNAATLNNNDRKVLDRYTKFYTNFIESNTARTDILEDEGYKPKT